MSRKSPLITDTDTGIAAALIATLALATGFAAGAILLHGASSRGDPLAWTQCSFPVAAFGAHANRQSQRRLRYGAQCQVWCDMAARPAL